MSVQFTHIGYDQFLADIEAVARRTVGATLSDTLFALQILGDDRAIHATYVAGRLAHGGTRA